MQELIDGMLRLTAERSIFTSDEIRDFLLDLRNATPVQAQAISTQHGELVGA